MSDDALITKRNTIKRWYKRSRIAGYTTGAIGVALFLAWKMGVTTNEKIMVIGFGLIILMFIFFVLSYIIRFSLRLIK